MRVCLTRIKQLMDDIDKIGKRKIGRTEKELRQEIDLIGDKFLKQQLTTYLSFRISVNKYGKNTD